MLALPEAGQKPNGGERRLAQSEMGCGCGEHDCRSGVFAVPPAGTMVRIRFADACRDGGSTFG